MDFNWGTGSPDPSIDGGYFSVRWTGFVEPRFSETYTFYIDEDEGARLWVNDQLLIDQWNSIGQFNGTIALTGGVKYSLRPTATIAFFLPSWRSIRSNAGYQ